MSCMEHLDAEDYLVEDLAGIRRAQAEIDRRFEEQLRLRAEGRLTRGDAGSFPASLILQAMIAAAALITTGAVIAKVLISH